MHVHGRMVGRKVQRREVIPVGLDLRTHRDGEADAAEDLYDLIDHPGYRVLGADPAVTRRHGEIYARLLGDPALGLETFTALREGLLKPALEPVDRGAVRLPLLRRPRGHRPKGRRELAVFAAQYRHDLRGKRVGIESGNRL